MSRSHQAGWLCTAVRAIEEYLRSQWKCCRASALGTEGVCVTELGLVEAAREALPFQLTAGQERALDTILRDMQGPLPMMCLLQVPPHTSLDAVSVHNLPCVRCFHT